MVPTASVIVDRSVRTTNKFNNGKYRTEFFIQCKEAATADESKFENSRSMMELLELMSSFDNSYDLTKP